MEYSYRKKRDEERMKELKKFYDWVMEKSGSKRKKKEK